MIGNISLKCEYVYISSCCYENVIYKCYNCNIKTKSRKLFVERHNIEKIKYIEKINKILIEKVPIELVRKINEYMIFHKPNMFMECLCKKNIPDCCERCKFLKNSDDMIFEKYY